MYLNLFKISAKEHKKTNLSFPQSVLLSQRTDQESVNFFNEENFFPLYKLSLFVIRK